MLRRSSLISGMAPGLILTSLMIALPMRATRRSAADVVITRGDALVLEPYAPNVMRVTLSLLKVSNCPHRARNHRRAAPQGWSYAKAKAPTPTAPRHGRACSADMEIPSPAKPASDERTENPGIITGNFFNGSTRGQISGFSTPRRQASSEIGWQMSVQL